jgi:outer membrane protein assembly factor BamB
VTGTGKNELVFAGSTGGHLCAYGALDGKIIWDFDTQGGISGGPIVVDGIVYVGSGNGLFGTGRKNNALYAFSIDGK